MKWLMFVVLVGVMMVGLQQEEMTDSCCCISNTEYSGVPERVEVILDALGN